MQSKAHRKTVDFNGLLTEDQSSVHNLLVNKLNLQETCKY